MAAFCRQRPRCRAAPTAQAAGTGTITITPPTGTDSKVTNTYKIYKVFEADGNGSNISYTLPSGKSTSDEAWTNSQMGTYFSVSNGHVTALEAATGSDGELSSGAVTAIAAWLSIGGQSAPNADFTATSTGTTAATASSVPNGYYYVTTSTGSVVTVTSTNPNASVEDKNGMPSVDKKITKVDDNAGSITTDGKSAIAQAGKKVTYTATITKAKGARNYVYHDKMDTNKLSFDSSSVTVTVSGSTVNTGESTYSVVTPSPDPSSDTFQVKFSDTYIASLADNTEITVSYTATVKDTGLNASTDTSVAKNDAHLTYGDSGDTTHSETSVYNATITVSKTFNGGNPASGDSAEFVLQRTSDSKYYSISDKVVSWVDSADSATKISFSAAGSQSFAGLPDGSYKLIEHKVPVGFHRAADTDVTVSGASVTNALTATNLNQSKSIENTAGFELPTTGGPGTAWMYAIGGVLVAAAAIGLIARRRMRRQ